jgi:phosphate/sulfate permease/DNA-binding CsgD family transcriptional regulator
LIKIKLPVSTSQAIVGGIIGWSVFTQGKIDWTLISEIVLSWILAPIIGVILGILFFVLMRWFLNRTRIHLIKLDFYLRITLAIVISLAAFGLGANNIGNVIGVFSNFAPNVYIDFGFFSINGLQILFLVGGFSIALGIYTYSRRSINETDEGILSLAPESAIVVLFAQAVVLFLFSSSWLASIFFSIGLPPIPLVPVSSTQIVVGALLGIGIVKGAREIEFKTLAGIGLSWVTTPLSAGILSYSVLFVLQKVFNFPYVLKSTNAPVVGNGLHGSIDHIYTFNMVLPGIVIISAIIILVFIYLFFRQQKLRLKVEKDMLIQQNQLFLSQKTMNELEMKTIGMENEALSLKLQAKRKEFMDIALNINDQRVFLEKISAGINEIIKIDNNDERTEKLKELSLFVKQRMSFSQEKKDFYIQIEEIHKDFHMKLKTTFPNLTDLEKRLAGLLRLNLSTKEISSLLNISPKSVEVSRYRLKKKLNLQKDKTLIEFINDI